MKEENSGWSPTAQPECRSVNFGSKLVALVANWAGFTDSADS
jgi:hypothetical protein